VAGFSIEVDGVVTTRPVEFGSSIIRVTVRGFTAVEFWMNVAVRRTNSPYVNSFAIAILLHWTHR
jgi:hypothetical protein